MKRKWYRDGVADGAPSQHLATALSEFPEVLLWAVSHHKKLSELGIIFPTLQMRNTTAQRI